MSFQGFPFVLFLIIALVGWRHLLPSPKARSWLLGLSLLFYGCWWPIAPLLLVLSGSIGEDSFTSHELQARATSNAFHARMAEWQTRASLRG